MLLFKLRRKVAEHDWFSVAIELLVVIAGILIALQFDDWAKERDQRRAERSYLTRLRDDITRENEDMEQRAALARSRIDAARLLERIAHDAEPGAADLDHLAWALRTVTWRSFPQIDAYVYRELQNSGKLELIRSDALRRHLAEHYNTLEKYAQVGNDFEAQHQFERDTIGLLGMDEMIAVENDPNPTAASATTPARAVEIARAFRERKQAIGLLANLAQHHTFNIKVIGELQEQGRRIMEEIDKGTPAIDAR